MYNSESESWWIPFQSLWLLDDKQWMKDRRKLWRKIKRNLDSERLPALELKGLEYIFITGYQFKEAPPFVDLEGIAQKMHVGPQQRLVLAPFTCESDYQKFICALPGRERLYDRKLSEIMDPFAYLTMYFNGMTMLETKADEIYRYVLGGGTIYDNLYLMENEQALRLYELPYQLNEYFRKISHLLQLHGYEEFPEYPEYWIFESMFDYYTSFAEFINENPNMFTEDNLTLRFSSFDDFQNPCNLKDERSETLYEKSREFIFGGRLPKAMRIKQAFTNDNKETSYNLSKADIASSLQGVGKGH